MADEQPTGTLLVVSSDPNVEEDLRSGVPEGLEVLAVTDAMDALVKMETFTPPAVVVDLRTGHAGGFHLSMDMDQRVRLAAVPVVVLIEREQDRWLAEQGGADVVLRKPVSGSQLWMAVSSLLPA